MKKHLNLTFTLVLGAFVALGLSACAEGQNGGGASDSTMTNADSAAAGGMQRGGSRQETSTARSTISLLRKGVRNIASNRAVQNINGWQKKIRQQGDSGASLSQLNDNLDQLKTELVAGGPPDGKAIGNLLSKLGQQTTQAVQDSTGPKMQRFRQLGQFLTKTGGQLSSGGS